MGDVFEDATEEFYRRHPDPFDERAPHSIFPDCKLGRLQKGKKMCLKIFEIRRRNIISPLNISALSDYPDFLDKMVEEFIINSTNIEINRTACRLLLLTLPGFEVQPTFNSFGNRLVPRLEQWSKKVTSGPGAKNKLVSFCYL